MIRLEAMPEFGVHRRRHWVVLTIGAGTASSITLPGLTVRRSENTIEIPSGGSMMIAGLLQENDGAQTGALTADPETKAIGEGFNLLVSFEYASARLSPTAKANLREFAKGISDPDLESAAFVIEGHTDGIGSASYNQRLSEDRASAVTEFLVSVGVARDRLKTVGYGKTRPKVADINDPANRRVESKLVLE